MNSENDEIQDLLDKIELEKILKSQYEIPKDDHKCDVNKEILKGMKF